MWALIELVFLAAIVLLSITEFFYPLMVGKPPFGSFRSRQETTLTNTEPLQEKVSRAKEKVKEIKDIQEEINSNFKTAEKLKEETDDLLNNTNK